MPEQASGAGALSHLIICTVVSERHTLKRDGDRQQRLVKEPAPVVIEVKDRKADIHLLSGARAFVGGQDGGVESERKFVPSSKAHTLSLHG